MSWQRIHDIKILSATASYLPEVGKIECIVKGAVLDIENNFLDLEGLKVFVGDKQAAEDATDMKWNFSTRLYFDFNPAVDALDMYLEHIPTEIQSSRKYIPIANLPKKKEPTPKAEPKKEVTLSTPKVEAKQETVVPAVQSAPASPISKWAAITAVRENWLALGDIKFAHLVDDKAVVMEAVKQNGLALEFASERLRKDKDIFNIAVDQNEDAALLAHEELYNQYRDALDSIITTNHIVWFKNIKKIAIKGLERHPEFFWNLSIKLRSDKELVLNLISQPNSDVHKIVIFVPNIFLDDEDIATAILQKRWDMLPYFSERLKDSKNIVLIAARNLTFPDMLSAASKRLQNDPDIKKAAWQ